MCCVNQTEENTVEEESPQYPYTVPIRFEQAGKPYSFGSFSMDIHKGDFVVVETAQGQELGVADADAIAIDKLGLRMPTRPVLRIATKEDKQRYEDNKEENDRAFDICNQEIQELGLSMNLLSAQYTLDRSKILFIYLAEQRVDFRELLKRLGSQLHCRIELRQIGERDKAKMVGGIGMCGMECCCRRFKSKFDVISINMAKNQLLALNIDKLSGMCGKLMCCLKYEDDDYKQLIEGLPKMGSQVEYEGEIYRITNMNVMSNEVKLENRENAVFISLEDLRTKAIPRKGVVQPKKQDDGTKPVHKTVIHANRPQEKKVEKKEKMDRIERPSNPNSKTEVRTFGKKKDNASSTNTRTEKSVQSHRNERSAGTNSRRHESHKQSAPVKNVTVRTFGKKKEESAS